MSCFGLIAASDSVHKIAADAAKTASCSGGSGMLVSPGASECAHEDGTWSVLQVAGGSLYHRGSALRSIVSPDTVNAAHGVMPWNAMVRGGGGRTR